MSSTEVAAGTPQRPAELPEHPAVVLARTGPEGLPLCVRMRTVRYGMRAALPLLIISGVIFVSLGALVAVAEGSAAPLLGFSVVPVVFWIPLAVFQAIRCRGPVLAADEHGVWLRPECDRNWAAWLPWTGVESVTVRRYIGLRALCVKPLDPTYDAWFSVRPTGNGDTKTGLRIVKVWRERALRTNLFVPLSHANHSEELVVSRLRELAADRCPVG